MKAPVERIVIFIAAVRAEGKAGHGCFGAVIRGAGDDAVAGTAVGAGYERVAITSVVRVIHFSQAVRADCRIGSNPDIDPAAAAGENGKGNLPVNGNDVCAGL